jgi:hypothetical protein
MEYNTLVAGLIEWRGNLFNLLMDERVATQPKYSRLITELDGYIAAFQTLETTNEPALTLARANPIDRYGCQLVVCRLYEQGEDTASIANHLSTFTNQSISIQQVEDWLEGYKATNLAQRGERQSSIFDTSSQLENLFVKLSSLIVAVEQEDDEIFAAGKTTRWDVLNAYQREMRALVKDARDTIQAVHNMNNMSAVLELIVQEIALESPIIQNRIYKRLERHTSLYTLFKL